MKKKIIQNEMSKTFSSFPQAQIKNTTG